MSSDPLVSVPVALFDDLGGRIIGVLPVRRRLMRPGGHVEFMLRSDSEINPSAITGDCLLDVAALTCRSITLPVCEYVTPRMGPAEQPRMAINAAGVPIQTLRQIPEWGDRSEKIK